MIMTRITVYRYDQNNQPAEAEGWFTPESAHAMTEANPMTAERYADAMRRGKPARVVIETLFHTGEGRWVRKDAIHVDDRGRWTENEAGARSTHGFPHYRFLSDAEALDWLTRNGYEDRIAAYLPDLPQEKGPGRPEVGGLVQVRLGKLLPSVDAYATEHRCSRAEAVRRLVVAGLSSDD
jgi:hypothetical protein